MRIIIGLLLTFGLVAPSFALDKVKLMQTFFSTVMVRGYKSDGGLAYGSGVVVGPNKVLTSCHTFRQTGKPWVSQGEETFSILSVKADRWHDLCLATTFGMPTAPVEIGTSYNLKKGEQVVSIGHSNGVPSPLTTTGTVRSSFKFDDGYIIRSGARFALGASGSGLYNATGQLIGINTFKTIGHFAYFYAVPIDWLKQLETMPDETVFPIIGKAFWEEDDDKKPYFMQTAIPEIKGNWSQLKTVSESWVKAEPNNVDAMFELGFANEHLGDVSTANTIYSKILTTEANHPETLFRIGVMARNSGDSDKVFAIEKQLADVDEDIAYDFTERVINCKKECDKL